MYKTGGYLSESLIEELEIIKETAHQVVIAYPYKDRHGSMGTRECREAKNSGNRIIHPTYEAARDFLKAKAEVGVRVAINRLNSAEKYKEAVSKL